MLVDKQIVPSLLTIYYICKNSIINISNVETVIDKVTATLELFLMPVSDSILTRVEK